MADDPAPGGTMRLSREDLTRIRDTLRSNLFDGDEGGIVKAPIRKLLDDAIEAIDIEFNGDDAFTYADEEAQSGRDA